MSSKSLKKYIWLSIAAALATIGLKFAAYLFTDSMGLFSDAMESGVNLLAAIFALIIISIAERPADEDHAYGHSKVEYFSSGVEGFLIVLAAATIIWTAVPRIISPQPIENLGIGIFISTIASLVNLVVARILITEGKNNNSIVLEADGKHLMTDVWTSAGVVVAIIMVKLTGLMILDPIIAVAVAINIVWSGYKLMHRSALGLIDTAIPKQEREMVEKLLNKYKAEGLEFHQLLTRQAGQRKFISVHILIPGEWSVQKGHDLLEVIEHEIRQLFSCQVTVFTHLEPIEDPKSHEDVLIDR